MAYRTIDRVASGIVFFGPTPADQTFESNSNFRIDTGNSRLISSNLTIANGGKIGSASQTGILTLGSDGVATFSSGVVITGDLTVNGTTTTVNTETINLADNVILLNSNETGVPSQDAGIEVERGTSTNVQFRWNETSDYWEFTNNGSTYFEIASRTGTQEFLNKTINGSLNTLTNIGNGSLTNSSVTVTAGNGLINGGSVSLGGSVTLNVGAGNGITVATDAVAVTDGSGILVDANGVHANLISYTAQTTAANAATTTASRTYPIQVDSSDKLVVNVPWTDTGMTFTISDGTNTQTISNTDTLRFQSGAAINFTVSATDTVSGTLNAAVAGVGLSMTNQVLAVDLNELTDAAIANGDSIIFIDATDSNATRKESLADLATLFAGDGLTASASVLAVNTGAGLEINTDAIRIATSAAGNGLTGGGGSALAVSDGSGILVTGGGVHANLISYASQAVAANAASATASRTYPIQVNGSDQLVVNVPWTDGGGTITSVVAGSGLVGGGSSGSVTLDVNTDNSTLEVNTDILRVKDDGITNAKLRNSAGLSVIGRSANTTGDPADITSSTDGHVLRQSGTTLGFGTVATAGLADGAVTEAKLFRDVITISNTGFTIITGDIVIMSAATNNASATLPAATEGRVIVFKRTDSSTNTCTITRAAAETIDGATSIALYYQYESVTLACDGTNWHVI